MNLFGFIPLALSFFRNDSGNRLHMDSASEIISRLKFISRLRKGDKIYVPDVSIQPETTSAKLSRTFYNRDNRYNTLYFIRNTCERAYELINFYEKSEKSSDKMLKKCIISDLIKSKQGILHLKDTYSSDIKFCCDLDVVIEEINVTLFELGVVSTEEKDPIH